MDFCNYFSYCDYSLDCGKGLNIGLWAFSFGLASMANSATAFYHGNVLQGVSIFAFVFSNVMIGLLVLMTIYKLTKGQFFLK